MLFVLPRSSCPTDCVHSLASFCRDLISLMPQVMLKLYFGIFSCATTLENRWRHTSRHLIKWNKQLLVVLLCVHFHRYVIRFSIICARFSSLCTFFLSLVPLIDRLEPVGTRFIRKHNVTIDSGAQMLFAGLCPSTPRGNHRRQ